MASSLFTVGLVGAWFSSNIGVILLNKYLLSNYGFRFPLFLTMCHMIACSLFSYLIIVWFKMVPMQPIRSRVQFTKIATLSAIFCASVVGGNISLRFLPVSFNQAVGATTPFFTAVFAYLITVEREAWLTYLTLVPVVAGVVIASGFITHLRAIHSSGTCIWVSSLLGELLRCWHPYCLFFNIQNFARSGHHYFFGMGVSGIAPILHKVLLYKDDPVVLYTTAYEVAMGVFYGLGAVVYATRIPERWKPGKFDIAGHSHQLFHVLVVAGAYTHYKAGLLYLEWCDAKGC